MKREYIQFLFYEQMSTGRSMVNYLLLTTGGFMQVMGERYAAAVQAAAGITSTKALTVSMVAFAADRAGVGLSTLFPILFEIVQVAS